MGYTENEQSATSGEPVELYAFRQGVTYYTYTSSESTINYGGKSYEPEIIGRGSIQMSTNSLKNVVEIEVDRTNEFGLQYRYNPPEELIELTIFRGHGTDFVTFWKGFVRVVKFTSKSILISASPKTSSLKRAGLMRKFQRTCSYPLYSTRCTVSKSAYEKTGTIISVDGRDVEATVFGTEADGWFTGGTFESGDYSHLIVNHVGTTITLSHAIRTLASDDSFSAYPGCNHSSDHCLNKFSNKDNFGGQEFIPTKNPFIGDSIEF